MDCINNILSVIESSIVTNRMQLPNFILCDTDRFVLEKFAFEAAKYLENNIRFCFKGIVQHFSIVMPYFCDDDGALAFLSRLQESICIARDCYDSFTGIVIMELSEGWSNQGINPSFKFLPDFIKEHQEICFMVLIKGSEADKNIENIRKCLLGSAIWIQLCPPKMELSYGINLFHSMARDLGYVVSNETSKILPDVLKKAYAANSDLREVICQTLLQIDLVKKLENHDTVITEKDLAYFPEETSDKMKLKIGFSVDR